MSRARRRSLLGLVAVGLLAVWPAAGQTVIDGDSLQVGAVRYRLNGVDAPEADQVCPDGWPAGFEARRYLEQLVDGKQVRCKVGRPTPKASEGTLVRAARFAGLALRSEQREPGW